MRLSRVFWMVALPSLLSVTVARGDPLYFTLLGRYSFGRMIYLGENVDTNFTGKASSYIDQFGVQLFAKPLDNDRPKWKPSASLAVEMHRQMVSGYAYYLLRGDFRFSLMKDSGGGGFRWGGTLLASRGRHLLLEIRNVDEVEIEEISRTSVGLGLSLMRRSGLNMLVPTDLLDAALGNFEIKRKRFLDFGVTGGIEAALPADATITPNPIDLALNPFAEVSATLSSVEKRLLEVKFRWIRHHYRWDPAAGGAEPSLYRNDVISLDFSMAIIGF